METQGFTYAGSGFLLDCLEKDTAPLSSAEVGLDPDKIAEMIVTYRDGRRTVTRRYRPGKDGWELIPDAPG